MKEAVVYILDASPSMNKPVAVNPKEEEAGDVSKMIQDDDTEPTSRLECAKKALVSMISELMLQSKASEVSVIVCKTALTSHHKIAMGADIEEEGEDVPFPNLTELTPGVVRPTVELLRQISKIETVKEDEATDLRGDFCDAIILAADALFERGIKYKFKRKIVLVTDAEHDVVMDVQQTLQVIDSLRDMDCRLEVIGLEFASCAAFDQPASAPTAKIKQEPIPDEVGSKRIRVEEKDVATPVKQDDDDDDAPDDDTMDDGSEDDDDINQVVYTAKEDREKLLVSLTEKTGGKVVAASTIQQVLDANKGKRLKTSRKSKFEFRIAPGLSIEARYIMMMKKENEFETLTKEAVLIDDTTGKPLRNDAAGEEITDKVNSLSLLVDEDHPDDPVDQNDRGIAIQFGSTLIPMSTFDYEGLKLAKPGPRMEILGYMERSKIPAVYFMGTPYFISGDESQKACAAISGLAQALERLDKVAICTLLKMKSSRQPHLGALFPLPEPELPHPIHLVFLRLPFAGEAKPFHMDSFEEYLEGEEAATKSKSCDDLIDSLMLPEDVLNPGEVPSPVIRSWNQTKAQRALDPKAEVVKVRPSKDDRMVTPPEVVKRAEPAMKAFEVSFPLAKPMNAKDKKKAATGRNGRKILTYKDYLDKK